MADEVIMLGLKFSCKAVMMTKKIITFQLLPAYSNIF